MEEIWLASLEAFVVSSDSASVVVSSSEAVEGAMVSRAAVVWMLDRSTCSCFFLHPFKRKTLAARSSRIENLRFIRYLLCILRFLCYSSYYTIKVVLLEEAKLLHNI